MTRTNYSSRYLTGGVNTADRRDRTHFFAGTGTAEKPLCGVRFVRVWNFEAALFIEFGEIESPGGPLEDVNYLKTDFAFTEEFVSQYHVCRRCLATLRRRLKQSPEQQL